jgi:UDP-2,3-diacylglucosamine hydrolase
LQACHATALPDPSVIDFAGERWLLSHGDALCVDDFAYQAFRRQVRSAEWQQDFLRKPLAERQDIARGLRQASTAKMLDSMPYADVDHPAALSLLLTAKAGHLLHGHTHKPGHHLLAPGMERTVLSDWDATASPPRAEVLRLSTDNHGRVAAVRMPAALIAIPEA